MNYRHSYHAGNFADLHKHAALALLLGHLQQKETAIHVIDCHAGIGRYDLTSVESGKTGEFREGIGRLWQEEDVLPASLRAVLLQENPGGSLRFYPGSPLLIRRLLRPIDRLTLNELHPEDNATLRALFARDRQVAIRAEDAYQALRALLPPKERRGLVLIDPPYEARDEFSRIVSGLQDALRRWPTGIYAIWYPIKSSSDHGRFKSELANFGRICLASELMLSAIDASDRLTGSGLAILNPPWRLDAQLESLTASLHRALGCQGETGLRWLVTG